MDKQNAKRAAAIAAAAAIGSTGGTLGADAVINNNNGVQNETEPSVDENSTHTPSSNHGHSSSHVSPSVDSRVEVVTTPENPDVQIMCEPYDLTIGPVIIDSNMYGGPIDPLYVPEDDEGILCMEDQLTLFHDPEDDEVKGMPALDDEEIPTGEETIIEDQSADNNPKEFGDVDYMV